MRLERGVRALAWAIVVVCWPSAGECADAYLRVSSDDVPIYSLMNNGEVIGRVAAGTVLRLSDDLGDWFKVSLFSGDARYVRKQFAAPAANYKPTPPADEGVRRQVFAAFAAAEDKSRTEAERLVPSSQVMRQIDVMRVLDDRYKLQVAQRFKVDPTIYRALAVEGVQKRWPSR